MSKKKSKIIDAPILSLNAKIELFAKFLRESLSKKPSTKKNITASKSNTPLKQKVKRVASKKIKKSSSPVKKKKTA